MRSRDGGALLLSISLLALSAALLGGAFAAARSAQRSVQSREAALLADAEVRSAIAEFVSQWSTTDDSLAMGSERSLVVGPRERGSSAVMMSTQLRLRRLSLTRYVVVADCQAGPDAAVLARRRVRVILDRAQPVDSVTPMATPAPIGRWTLADLH